MNQMAEILLEDSFYTVKVIFDQTENYADSLDQRYTYKVDKKLTLIPGDVAIINYNSKFKFCRVVQADSFANIDINSSKEYNWVVQKLELSTYEELLNRDKKVRDLVKETEKRKKKAEIVDMFSFNLSEDQLVLFKTSLKELGVDL